MNKARRAAELLIATWRNDATIDELPSDLAPDNVEEAYLVQNEIISLIGPPVAWKLTLEALPRVSPLPAAFVRQSPASLPIDPRYKIECEVGIVVGDDVLDMQDADTIRPFIQTRIAAFEIIRSRFSNPQPKHIGLADLASCHAVATGAPITWSGDLDGLNMALSIDGQIVARSDSGASTASLAEKIAWFANHAIARNLPLRRGQVIMTGARIKWPAPAVPGRLAISAGVSDAALAMLDFR